MPEVTLTSAVLCHAVLVVLCMVDPLPSQPAEGAATPQQGPAPLAEELTPQLPASSTLEQLEKEKTELEISKLRADLSKKSSTLEKLTPYVPCIAILLTLVTWIIAAVAAMKTYETAKKAGLFDASKRLLDAQGSELRLLDRELLARQSKLDEIDHARVRGAVSLFEEGMSFLTDHPTDLFGLSQRVTGILDSITLHPKPDELLQRLRMISSNDQRYPVVLFVLYHATNEQRWHRVLIGYLEDAILGVTQGRVPVDPPHGGDVLRSTFRVLSAREWDLVDRIRLARVVVGRMPSTEAGYRLGLSYVVLWLLGPPIDSDALRREHPDVFVDVVVQAIGLMMSPDHEWHRFYAAPDILVHLAPQAFLSAIADMIVNPRYDPEYFLAASNYGQSREFLKAFPEGARKYFLSDPPSVGPPPLIDADTGYSGYRADPNYGLWNAWYQANKTLIEPWIGPAESLRPPSKTVDELFKVRR